MAAALAMALGQADALERLSGLRGVRGRMELAARLPNGAAVYVDYAHTPGCAGTAADRAAPAHRRAGCMWCSAPAATATAASVR